jgi:hypothetical protein
MDGTKNPMIIPIPENSLLDPKIYEGFLLLGLNSSSFGTQPTAVINNSFKKMINKTTSNTKGCL